MESAQASQAPAASRKSKNADFDEALKSGNFLKHPIWDVMTPVTDNRRKNEDRRWYLSNGLLVECDYLPKDKGEELGKVVPPPRGLPEALTFDQVQEIWKRCAAEKRCIRDVTMELLDEDDFSKAQLERQKAGRKVFVAPDGPFRHVKY